MEFTQDLIRSLHSSAVFEGIPVKDLRDLLREIDARVMELSEGQLLRRAGDCMDFYPSGCFGHRASKHAARWARPPGGAVRLGRVVCRGRAGDA